MKAEQHFPTASDVEALLAGSKTADIRASLAPEGIFLACPVGRIPEFMGRYLLEEDWYSDLIESVEQKRRGFSITGTRVSLPASEVRKIVEAQSLATPLVPGPDPIWITSPHVTANVFRFQVEYEKRKANKASFFQRERRSFWLEVYPGDGSPGGGAETDVVGFTASNGDALAARRAFEVLVGKYVVDVHLEDLPLPARVTAFDQLLASEGLATYRVAESCGFTIRRGHDETDDVDDAQMHLLNSAILEGRSLRTHPFVEDLIGKSYYFSATTFWATSRLQVSDNSELKVAVSFKQNPKVILVSVGGKRTPTEGDGWDHGVPTKAEASTVALAYWRHLYSVLQEQKHVADQSGLIITG